MAPHAFEDLLGVRSSKGRYYSEYRHTAHDLQRTLQAVNAVSWVLADAPGDPRYLVDSTLPVIAQLLDATAVVLVSEDSGLQGAQVCLPGLHPMPPGCSRDQLAESLVRHADLRAAGCPPTGVLRAVPELGIVLLIAPMPRGAGRSHRYVLAAVPQAARADGTDLAILGTLTNQLAGALESARRLSESERLRQSADRALRDADEQATALAKRNLLLKRARQELVGARESQVLAEERQRIARDLHDSVAQHVLSMGMQVEWCRTSSEQPEVVERLVAVKELARTTVDRIRQAIFELSGGDALEAQGLVPALRLLAEQHGVHGLQIDVRVMGARLGRPVAVDQALFMVAREALFNTVAHGEASRAVVRLSHTGGHVRLQVCDDGLGQADQLRQCLAHARLAPVDGYHRGLANIEDRVRAVGGRLDIDDEPGRGACRSSYRWTPTRITHDCPEHTGRPGYGESPDAPGRRRRPRDHPAGPAHDARAR